MKLTENDNRELEKPPIHLVDELANKLCTDYSNHDFYKWYCKIINILGLKRVEEIQAMSSDAKYPGTLFSKRAQQEAINKVGQDRYKEMMRNYGKASQDTTRSL